MAVLKLDQFDGIYPRTAAHLLPPNAAVKSEWVDHQYGELHALAFGGLGLTVNSQYAGYVWSPDIPSQGKFYSWPNYGDPVGGVHPAPNGALDQDAIYYAIGVPMKGRIGSATQNGGPPPEQYYLGVPKPNVSWTVNYTGGSGTPVTNAYVYTYVNAQGEEGPPSDPITITHAPGATITITVNAPSNWLSPVGSEEYQHATKFRVYRTQTGGAVDEYYFSVEGALPSSGSATVTDAALVNEALASYDYYPAPITITGMAASPSGALVGWGGKTLYFSVEKMPWAWPPLYKYTLRDKIVAVVPHESGLLVLTDRCPYLVAGVPFEVMSPPIELSIPYGAVSPYAVARLPGGTAYMSTAGIVIVNGGTGSLALSERFFTPEQWSAKIDGQIMQMAYHGGRLLVFSAIRPAYTPTFVPFMIRLDVANPALTELPGFTASGVGVLRTFPSGDALFAFQYTSGALSTALPFGVGTAHALAWRSREAVMAHPASFGAAAVRCSGTFDVSIYADGVLRHTEHVTGDKTFRLPSGFKARHWQAEVAGSGTFKTLCLAGAARELQGV